MQDLARRLALVDELFADPPKVHIVEGEDTAGWATERDAYRFLAQHVRPGSRTVETGCGMSTALFALWGCDHVSVPYEQYEADKIRAYLTARGADPTLELHVGSSSDVLPSLDLGHRDLVFLDGSHSWPMAIIDWFYTAGTLGKGGILVLDDTQLKQVSLGLDEFLSKDPRWEQVEEGWKWAAYRRLVDGPILDEWWKRDQAFLGVPWRDTLGQKVPARLRPPLKQAAVKLKSLLPG